MTPVDVRIYTLAELVSDTARVLQEIDDGGRDALVTRRGQPIVMITPLMNSDIESLALSSLIQEGLEESRDQ